jgi:putative glutamine amidotransferase
MSETDARRKSVVGVITDCVDFEGTPTNSVRTRYMEALADTADVLPVLLPTTLTSSDVDSLVEIHLDGILLTGSTSNVHPDRYSQQLRFDERLIDKARDNLAIAAIRSSMVHGKPLLGICRGLQEVNVAFGGTLHQDLRKVRGVGAHHEDLARPRDEQYLPAHSIVLAPKGAVGEIVAPMGTSELQVNSLHRQGIDRLGAGLSADAVAPDGLIEAISVVGASVPIFAVQWHLEWFHGTDPVSRALLQAFATFCEQRRAARNCS